MKVRVFYQNKMWEVVTEFYRGGSTFGRLERKNADGNIEVAFPSGNEIKVRNEWTGLEDKHGTPIFGGDVVKLPWFGKSFHDIVTWDIQHTGYLPFSKPQGPAEIYIRAGACEVVGNIYENPELEKLVYPEVNCEQTKPTA